LIVRTITRILSIIIFLFVIYTIINGKWLYVIKNIIFIQDYVFLLTIN
jgi:hypothetical protein